MNNLKKNFNFESFTVLFFSFLLKRATGENFNYLLWKKHAVVEIYGKLILSFSSPDPEIIIIIIT